MKRLTERIKGLQKDDLIVYTNGKYKDTIPAEMTNDDIRAVLKKLADYEDLEEQGLLVRLPCKVGTEVFCFFPGDSHYTKCQIKKIEICSSIFGNICYFAEPVGQRGCCCRYFDNEFGKFLFLTREEAEKKLKELRN